MKLKLRCTNQRSQIHVCVKFLFLFIRYIFSSALCRKSMCSFRKGLKIVCLIFLCYSVSESSFDRGNIYRHIYFLFFNSMHFQYFLKLICNLCRGVKWENVPRDVFFLKPRLLTYDSYEFRFLTEAVGMWLKGEKASDDMCQFVILIFVFESGIRIFFFSEGEKSAIFESDFFPTNLRVIEMQSTVLRKTLFDFVCIKVFRVF